MKKYRTGIYIGKFFPFQKGHLVACKRISEYCEKTYVVFYNNIELEQKLNKQFEYSIDERIEDAKQILKRDNIEVIKFTPSKNLNFPNDFLKIKEELFKQIKVTNIDLQIFGQDEEETYKDYIYANKYILAPNLHENGLTIHANLIRNNYDKYKHLLDPIIRKRLDNKFGKQKYICIIGKSGSGKSTLSKYIQQNISNCITLDIDKLVHESLTDEIVKSKILTIVQRDILDENANIDRKKLGAIVFNNKDLKNKVYSITWDYVDDYIKNIFQQIYNYVILDWYNINTKNYFDIATFKILVERDYDSRKKAVIERDGITSEYFELREKNSNDYKDCNYDLKIDISNESELESLINIIK